MNTQRHRSGFSLVEVMVGVAVLLVIGGMLASFTQSASSQSEFGAEHFTAMLLSQKVLEDCSQEILCNPYAFSTLGIDSGVDTPVGIVEAQSPFFTFIEDHDAPRGKLDNGGVTSTMAPLYGQIKDFRISVSAQRNGGTVAEQSLYLVDVGFRWKTRVGRGELFADCIFPSCVLAKKIADADYGTVDATQVEKEICQFFYGDNSKTILQQTATRGGDATVIKEMGEIWYWGNNFFKSNFAVKSNKEYQQTRTKLQATSDPAEKYRLEKSLADSTYEMARASFRLLCYLKPKLDKVMTEFDQTRLGTYLWTTKKFAWVDNIILVWRLFYEKLVETKSHLERLTDLDMMPYQDLRTVHARILRIIDLYKVLYTVPNSPWAGQYGYFEFVRKSSESRNPSLCRFIQQEEEFAKNGTLLDRYPTLKKIADMFGTIMKFEAFLRANGGYH